MSQSPPYGLLLIAGCHTHQENYARAFLADPRCKVVGLTDEENITHRRRELNEQLASELNVPYLPDLDAALERKDVDLVSLCAEPERRAALMLRCAKAGKHLYIDKEVGTTSQSAWEVVKAVKEAGVRSQVFSLVRMPMAQRAKAILESGELGELMIYNSALDAADLDAVTTYLSKKYNIPLKQPSAAVRQI